MWGLLFYFILFLNFAATFVLNVFVCWWRPGKLWEFESPNLHRILFEQWNAVAMATSADGWQLAGVSLTWSSLSLRAKKAMGSGGVSDSHEQLILLVSDDHPLTGWFNQYIFSDGIACEKHSPAETKHLLTIQIHSLWRLFWDILMGATLERNYLLRMEVERHKRPN